MPMSPRLLRPRSTVHPEATAWATRVIANGGTFSSSTLSAVSTFCASIDRESGLRAAILRCNLLCGNNLEAVMVPLYRAASISGSTLGNATDTNSGPFVSADYTERGSGGGLKGNGTTKYLETGLAPSVLSSFSSVHMSVSATSIETASNASNATEDKFFIGTFNGTEATIYDLSAAAFLTTANRRFSRIGTFANLTSVSATGRSAESHMISTRTSTTSATLYADGTSINTNAGAAAPGTSTRQWIAFGLNNQGSAGVFSACRMRMYSIGNGLTAAQALAFSNAVIAFNGALGRA